MGNKVVKEHDTSCPTETWDKDNNRPKCFYADGTHVFNFYGEYSRDEFLKANVDDPEFEKKVKEDVEQFKIHEYIYRRCKSISRYIYHKDKKYGFAWFNMAYINPMCTIDLLCRANNVVLKIQRFLYDNHVYIKFMPTNSTVKWSVTNADVAANYVCDMVDGVDISVVQNDVGVQETCTNVTDVYELQCILKKLIEYMMSIQER